MPANLSNAQKDLDMEMIEELWSPDMITFGLDDIMTNYAAPNTSTVNSRSIFGGDQSQSGIPQAMMSFSNLAPNSSTATLLQTSGHIFSDPVPKFIPNPPSQSSQPCGTTVLPQFTNQNQPLKQQVFENIPQQPPTHPSMSQSTFLFGHLQNNQQMSLDQIRPSPRPVSTIQTRHLLNQQTMMRPQSNIGQLQQRQHHMIQPLQNFQQNQNQTQLQFQQHIGTSNILIPESGQHTVQGLVISEGHRKPQEQRQGNISAVLSAPVGFMNPNVFPSNEMWREYAFRQVSQLREIYISELLKMHRKTVNLCTQETNMEVAKKYENAKEFLEKIVKFLNIHTVDLIPRNSERVYNYMNFIVNYMTSFRNKNGGSSQIFDQIDQQPLHQPPDSSQFSGSQLQPNRDMRLQYNMPASLPHGIVNLENNIVNLTQKPIHQLASSQKGPQMQPNGGMVLQNIAPPNPSQGIANREANIMMNFNQNFPSRRPHGRMPSSLSNGSFQMGNVNPLRIGSFTGAQPSVLGSTQRSNLRPNTSSVNVSGSSMSLLNAATSDNFPSRQLNHQPSLFNQSFNSEKMKLPMHKSNEFTGSNVGQTMSPLASLFRNQFHSPEFPHGSAPKPMILHPGTSSWQVNANSVMSAQSIARSPFLLGSSSQHAKPNSSSGVSLVSTVEGQRQEIPIIAGLFRDQQSIKNQVSDMGPPRTPMVSPMDTPCTEKSKEPQVSKDPHLRLTDVVKSLPSKTLGSSVVDIDSVQKDLDSLLDHGKPTKPAGGDLEKNITNFLQKNDHIEQEEQFPSISDGEPVNLDHLNIGEETAFLNLADEVIITSSSRDPFPEFCDYDFDQIFSKELEMDSGPTPKKRKIDELPLG